MTRTAVKSSNIKEVGYDPKNKILEIEFHTNGVYQYFDVPMSYYHDMLFADSMGQFFATAIKGKYSYQKVS